MIGAVIALVVVVLADLIMTRFRRRPSVQGKNVLVTGGSQGLGLAVAKLAAAQGANVVICSRSENKLQAALAEVKEVRYVAADVSTLAGADGAVRACGFTPDMVYCCAGGAKPGFFLEQEEADFELALRTDYWTALSTAHAAAGAMVRGGVRGHVVFVSSVLGFMGFVGYAQYSPMKYAIRGLAECLRSELLPHGIHVHAFFPATILSPGYEQENATKPEVTKAVEGADAGLAPEQCAAQLLRGVERDEFFIADGFVGRTLRICSSGTAPGNGPFLLELFAGMLARVAMAGWRRFAADRTVLQYARRARP